jgi:HlyD family secretion protein
MTRRGKIQVFAGALALVAALAWLARPGPVVVEIVPVTRGPMAATVDASAKTRVRERRVIVATASGFLRHLDRRAGDRVEPGAVLATLGATAPTPLDPRTHAELEARLGAAVAGAAEASAGIERARVALAHAEQERARIRTLFDGGAATRQASDAADFEVTARRTELRSAELAELTARQSVALVRAQLAHRFTDEKQAKGAEPPVLVRSPIEGRVLRVLTESEGPVLAGTPLLELGTVGVPEVVVEVLTADAVRVASGARVAFERWGGQEKLGGIVREVEPAAFTKVSSLGVEEQRVNVLAEPAGNVAAWATLGDGFRLEARIVTWEGEATRAPLSAMARDGDAWTAFRVRGGRAELVRVTLGHRADGDGEVLAGLTAGDRVIAYPGTRVRDGVRVRAE